MSKIESLKRPEISTSEKVKIPGFGNVEISPSTNSHTSANPGKPKIFTKEGNKKEISDVNYAMNCLRERRVIPDQSGVKSFEGSLEYVMILMAANSTVSPEKAVDLVNEWEKSEGRTFTYFRSNKEIGSEYLSKAKENPDLYYLTKEKLTRMMRHIGNKLNNEQMIARVSVLTKNDQIGAVIEIKSNYTDPKTVNTIDDLGNEHFAFDNTLHEKNLESLAFYANSNGIRVTGEGLKAISDGHRHITLSLIAEEVKKELPVLEIDLTGKEAKVTPRGFVKPIPQRA